MPDLHLVVIIPSSLRAPQLNCLHASINSLTNQRKSNSQLHLTICVVSETAASQRLKATFPDVDFLKSPTGSGFAEVNNFALHFLQKKIAQRKLPPPQWLLLLNDDAWVAEDFVAQLTKLELLSKTALRADMYTPLILEAKNKTAIDSYGVEYFKSGYAKNNRSMTISTTLATAGCLLLRWAFVEKLQAAYGFFFNPAYFYYLEDVDLSIRARMIGGKLSKTEKLVAYHHGSATSGGKRNTFSLFYTYRNLLWVIVCCWPTAQVLRNLPNILVVQSWAIIYGTSRCGILTYPKIIAQTLMALPRLLRYRRIILAAYEETDFSALFANYNFRTYHDQTIPAL